MAVLALAAPVFAAEKTPGIKERVCVNSDLAGGTWKMMDMTESPHRKELNSYLTKPFQYLTFYNNAQWSYLLSNTEIKSTKKVDDLMRYWPKKGNHTLQYQLTADGTLDLYLDKKLRYGYHCVIVVRDYDGYVKGDLRLTGYSGQYRKGKLYKLYRRWF